MKIKEIIKKEKGNYKEVEIYQYKDRMHRLHSDFIDDIDELYSYECYKNIEASDYYLMDEEEYNRTILANSCLRFHDMNEKDDMILVILISHDINIRELSEKRIHKTYKGRK